MFENMILDYIPAKECKRNKYCTCIKCGECGRKFENGIMVDDGGTTTFDDEE